MFAVLDFKLFLHSEKRWIRKLSDFPKLDTAIWYLCHIEARYNTNCFLSNKFKGLINTHTNLHVSLWRKFWHSDTTVQIVNSETLCARNKGIICQVSLECKETGSILVHYLKKVICYLFCVKNHTNLSTLFPFNCPTWDAHFE